MIRGELVALRPVEDEDLPAILRWENDPEVWWLMDRERPLSLDDVRDEIAAARVGGHPFVITVDGRAVGRVGLDGFRRKDRACSIHVYVGEPDARGKGYARDAVMALLTYAFDRLDLHQVEGTALAEDDGSLAAYEGCGFVREATLRDRSFRDGRWMDHAILSVRRDELAAARERGASG